MLIPDITTLSPLLSEGDVDINADIFPLSFSKRTTSLNVSIVVSKDVISLPFILLTTTFNPLPSVSVLSNIAALPTL